jgi:hypothetical protein
MKSGNSQGEGELCLEVKDAENREEMMSLNLTQIDIYRASQGVARELGRLNLHRSINCPDANTGRVAV